MILKNDLIGFITVAALIALAFFMNKVFTETKKGLMRTSALNKKRSLQRVLFLSSHKQSLNNEPGHVWIFF